MKRLFKKIRLWLIKKLHATPDEEVNKLIASGNKIAEQLRFYTNRFTKCEISSKIYVTSPLIIDKDIIPHRLISEMMHDLVPLIEINTKHGTNGKPDEIIGKLIILRRNDYDSNN